MTTEEQLSWHRDSGPSKADPAQDGFGSLGGTPLARGFAPQAAQPFGHSRSSQYGFQAAPPLENKPAKSGLILSLVSLLINPLLIIGIIGVVKGGQGLNRARQLESMGYHDTRRGSATAAVLVGILSTLWWAALIVLGVMTYLAVSGYHHEVVERSIAQSVEQQSGVAVTVVCPQTESTAAGTTFECTVTGSNGAIVYAQVKFTDSSGHFLANITTTSTAGAPADSSGTS
jgi:hypothetical protein